MFEGTKIQLVASYVLEDIEVYAASFEAVYGRPPTANDVSDDMVVAYRAACDLLNTPYELFEEKEDV